MIFGYFLLNDWSARDIQTWEYQPLGPSQAKAFGTTINPWIVTRAALEPFRAPGAERINPLLPHLREQRPGLYDIALQWSLNGDVLSRTNYREMYYSSAQQLAHHASSGCPMRVGDLLGSGTISGPEPDTTGALLERTAGGKNPVTLGDGSTRASILYGDSIEYCAVTPEGDGCRIGFRRAQGHDPARQLSTKKPARHRGRRLFLLG